MSTPTYWVKEIPARRLFLPNGAPVPFVEISREYGLLETSDPFIIGELDKAVARQVGGVSRVTQEEFEDLKKKFSSASSQLSLPRDRETLRAMSSSQLKAVAAAGRVADTQTIATTIQGQMPPQLGERVTAAEPQKVAPLDIPKSFSPPKVGKVEP